MLKYDVLCVGSATIDHFLEINGSLSSVKAGDKILVKKMEIHTGGGATNSAASLSKLGLKVKMLTKLGQDHNAEFISTEMKKYKVKNICKHFSKENTDFSTLISSENDKDRIIYVHKGASTDLTITDIKRSQLNPRWIYLASLVGKSFHVAKELASYAHRKNIKLLFNPSLYLTKKGKKYLQPVLENTTILVLNKEEAQSLLNTKESSIKKLALSLQELGPQAVVITNGKGRLYALYKDKFYSSVPPNVNVVHTAGAGDAFTSGLLFGAIKKFPFEESIKVGIVNACSVIRAVGTKNGLLTETAANEIIKKLKIEVKC